MLTKESARPSKESVRFFRVIRHDETTTTLHSRKTCLALKVSPADPGKLTAAAGWPGESVCPGGCRHAHGGVLRGVAVEALARFGKPGIFNTDQGAQFTSDGSVAASPVAPATILRDAPDFLKGEDEQALALRIREGLDNQVDGGVEFATLDAEIVVQNSRSGRGGPRESGARRQRDPCTTVQTGLGSRSPSPARGDREHHLAHRLHGVAQRPLH
jgi:hypothetical protein